MKKTNRNMETLMSKEEIAKFESIVENDEFDKEQMGEPTSDNSGGLLGGRPSILGKPEKPNRNLDNNHVSKKPDPKSVVPQTKQPLQNTGTTEGSDSGSSEESSSSESSSSSDSNESSGKDDEEIMEKEHDRSSKEIPEDVMGSVDLCIPISESDFGEFKIKFEDMRSFIEQLNLRIPGGCRVTIGQSGLKFTTGSAGPLKPNPNADVSKKPLKEVVDPGFQINDNSEGYEVLSAPEEDIMETIAVVFGTGKSRIKCVMTSVEAKTHDSALKVLRSKTDPIDLIGIDLNTWKIIPVGI